MASKRTHGDSSEEIESNDGNEDTAKATAFSKKRFTGSKMYKVSFRKEWKASYPISEVKHDKNKFHCLPCEKDLTCHHQGSYASKTPKNIICFKDMFISFLQEKDCLFVLHNCQKTLNIIMKRLLVIMFGINCLPRTTF